MFHAALTPTLPRACGPHLGLRTVALALVASCLAVARTEASQPTPTDIAISADAVVLTELGTHPLFPDRAADLPDLVDVGRELEDCVVPDGSGQSICDSLPQPLRWLCELLTGGGGGIDWNQAIKDCLEAGGFPELTEGPDGSITFRCNPGPS